MMRSSVLVKDPVIKGKGIIKIHQWFYDRLGAINGKRIPDRNIKTPGKSIRNMGSKINS